MEFVRLKFANNKLFTANLKEHTEVIEDFVARRGYDYLGFVPVVFGPSGKMMEIDLIFKEPESKASKNEKVTKVDKVPADAKTQAKK